MKNTTIDTELLRALLVAAERGGWEGGLQVIKRARDTMAAADLSPESDQPECTHLENCDEAPALTPLIHRSGS